LNDRRAWLKAFLNALTVEHSMMEEIRDYLRGRQDEMLTLLERLVNIDSGTYCKRGIDACGQILTEELRTLGFQLETIPETDWGNHVRAERVGLGKQRLFLSAHLDTVWPAGTVAKRPFRVDGNLAYGPGVGDMKGGIVQMIYALKALHDLGRKTPPLSIFLTGDEEVGSVQGRPHIEAEARRSAWVLVLEPGTGLGNIAIRRWGVGAYYLTIHGKAAHAMNTTPDAGVNACRELALKILALEGLSDPLFGGVKVSVNLVRGGTSRQVTASEARADIDVRVRDASRMAEIEERVRDVAENAILPGIRIELHGTLTRPPMEPNPDTEVLLRLATEVGRTIGIAVCPVEKFGGSDGCFTAAVGAATFCGMGPICHDSCGETERIEVDSLVPRTLLIAGIMQRLAKEA
jgi:glutamate carboxypeptidase